jgi:biopolymer transport protein ExbB/TolQ
MALPKRSDVYQEIKKITNSPKHQEKLNALKKAKREAWNKDLVKMDMEIPLDLYKKVEVLAKQAKMSTSQAFNVLLTEQVKNHAELEERIRRTIEQAFDEEYDRLAGPLELETKKMEEFNRLMFELFPDIKRKLHEKAKN